MAHDHGHGDGHAHDGGDDKRAAYVGLFTGVVVLGAFIFGMVTWTNHHLAGSEGERPAAAEAGK